MQILVHLGLNKCASTYIQQALAAAHTRFLFFSRDPSRSRSRSIA